MTSVATWSWWTYFIVGDDVISCGRIVSYDVGQRRVEYFVDRERAADENPHPPGTHEYEEWFNETRVGTYDRLWVDPDRSIALSVEDFDALRRGVRPATFVELGDQDPESYFDGARVVMSTYFKDEP